MKRIKKVLFTVVAVLLANLMYGQLKVGDNPTTINPGSVLEIESTDKAVILPRMTTAQMLSIPSPTYGMLIYNMDSNCLVQYRAASGWMSLCASSDPNSSQSIPGADGKSAYQIAVDGGYTGTEAQWLASLQGATGPAGSDATADGDAWGVSGEDLNSDIYRDGKVAIGETGITGAVEIAAGNTLNKGTINIKNPDGTSQGYIGGTAGDYMNYTSSTTGKHYFNDKVGINTEPTERLEVFDGTIKISKCPTDGIELQVGGNGGGYGNRSSDKGIAFTSTGAFPGTFARITSGDQALSGANGDKYLGFQVGTSKTHSSTKLLFLSSTASDDRIGIKNENPQATLDIASVPRTGTHSYSGGPMYVTGDIGILSGGLEVMRTDGTKGVGLGSDGIYASGSNGSNSFSIQAQVAASVIILPDGGGSTKYNFSSTDFSTVADNSASLGTATTKWTAVYATNGTIQTSDARLKKNVRPIGYGLADVMRLRPVVYDWKNDTGKNKIGFIAQEIREIVPNVVLGDESIENLGVNYAELVPVLTKAIQEQQKIIDAQEERLQKLESLVQKLNP